jgi:hypothetical protein
VYFGTFGRFGTISYSNQFQFLLFGGEGVFKEIFRGFQRDLWVPKFRVKATSVQPLIDWLLSIPS